MRSYRNTHLSFGLVNIPVCLYNTTKTSDVKFEVCDKEGVKLKRGYYAPVEVDGSVEIIPDSETERAFEGVVIDRDALNAIKQEAKLENGMDLRALNIESFIPLNTVPFNRVHGWYYVGVKPDSGTNAKRGYATMVKAMEHEGVAAVCKWVATTRQTLMVVYPQDGMLMAVILNFAADVVAPDDDLLNQTKDVEVNEGEFNIASQLIGAMYDHEGEYIQTAEDTAVPKLRELAEAASAGRDFAPSEIPSQSEMVPDLMKTLRASLAQQQGEKAKA